MPAVGKTGFFAVLLLLLVGCTTLEVAVDIAKKTSSELKKDRAQSVIAEDASAAIKPADAGKKTSTVKAAPRYKIGDPYEVGGVWYYPERDLNYDETGIASWYGDAFAGKLTANGEIFDPTLVSAAHKTLPMPSAVRVTNLENGRSMVIRINDRGPFVAGRIIDLSREAARLLGFQKQGIARVRVQILVEESLRLETAAKSGDFPDIGEYQQELPPTTPASLPAVSLTTSRTKTAQQPKSGNVSALDLLAAARAPGVISLPPVDTQIWVQVGAFVKDSNARNVAARISPIGTVTISRFDTGEAVLHRVRLGPAYTVEEADILLQKALDSGFSGAKIVLE